MNMFTLPDPCASCLRMAVLILSGWFQTDDALSLRHLRSDPVTEQRESGDEGPVR